MYFSSPFAIAKRLEMRLSVSPATLYSDASVPNHTKMFELVHMVTSMDDFGLVRVGGCTSTPFHYIYHHVHNCGVQSY